MSKKMLSEKMQPAKTMARGRIGPVEGAKIKELSGKGLGAAEISAEMSRSEDAINRFLHPESAPVANKGKRSNGAAHEADPISTIPQKLRGGFINFCVQNIAAEYKVKLKSDSNAESAVRSYLKVQELQQQLADELEKLKAF